MAVTSSGLITLNAVHIEKDGYGASGQPVTLNDADLRQMNSGPGQTIPTGSGTPIELSDFYGATDHHQIIMTNGVTGVYIGGASSWRINGFMTAGSFGTGNGGYPSTGSISSNSRSGMYAGATIAAIFVRYHTNAKYTDTVLILNGNVPNTITGAGWGAMRIQAPGYGFGAYSGVSISRYYATYSYNSNNNTSMWYQQTGYTQLSGNDVPPVNGASNATSYVEIF